MNLFAGFLAHLYGWNLEWIRFMGFVNLLYGCYSGTLYLILRRRNAVPRSGIIALILANSAWAGVCFSSAWWLPSSLPGTSHLLFEGAFVLGLAFLDARFVLDSPWNSGS